METAPAQCQPFGGLMTMTATANNLADAIRSASAPGSQGMPPHDSIVGRSPALRDALNRIERVGPLDTNVLITGETGTGKELMARVLHRGSHRATRPFVAVNL